MLETLIKLKESLIAQGISGAPIDAIDEAIEAARQQASQSAADVEAAANKAKQSAAQAGAETIKVNERPPQAPVSTYFKPKSPPDISLRPIIGYMNNRKIIMYFLNLAGTKKEAPTRKNNVKNAVFILHCSESGYKP